MFDYVETLRARRGVPWALAVLAVLILGFPVYALLEHADIHTGASFSLPLSALLLIGCFVALIAAAPFGASIARQRPALMTRWTLPVPRTRAMVAIFAADLVAMAALAAGTVVLCLLAVGILGLMPYVVVDENGLVAVAGAAGPIVFFYGWVHVLNAVVPNRSEALSGLAWLPFLFDVWFAKSRDVWEPVHQAGAALLWINPLGYLTGIQKSFVFGRQVREVVANPLDLQPLVALVISLALGAAMLAIAASIWNRREI